MLKFKDFLNEGTELLLERAESVNWLVFNERSHIPLSKKMLIRLQGEESVEKYGIHITNDDGLYDLIRIQNSAKQISVIINPFENVLFTGGGVYNDFLIDYLNIVGFVMILIIFLMSL